MAEIAMSLGLTSPEKLFYTMFWLSSITALKIDGGG